MGHQWVGGCGDGRHLQLASHGPLVQRLYVLDDMHHLVRPRVDGALGEAEEHECVVGVGAMANA